MTGDDRRLIGHATSCVVVADDVGVPLVVLDGGTGYLSAITSGGVTPAVPVLLSHLHHDHVAGLAAAPARAGRHVDVRVPIGPDLTLTTPVGDAASAALGAAAGVPVPHLSASALTPGDLHIGALHVRAREIPHGVEPTMGFRVSDGRGCFAYLPDHAPQRLDPGPNSWGAYHHDAVDLAYGADLLLHGAMFDADSTDEDDTEDRTGHTTVQYAVGLAERCHVGALVLVHHHPSHTDRDVAALVDRLRSASAIPVIAGREGAVLVPHDVRASDPSRRR